MKIRDRSGVVREVSGSYILADGESMVVEAMFMDARRMIHDASGRPAGTRPGFLFADNENERARADAYAEYDRAISERWKTAGVRQGPDQSQTTRSEPQPAPQTFDSAEAAVADAYRQYDRDISERWRKGPGQPAPSAPHGAAPQRTHDSPPQQLADPYAQYDREISERWKRQW